MNNNKTIPHTSLTRLNKAEHLAFHKDCLAYMASCQLLGIGNAFEPQNAAQNTPEGTQEVMSPLVERYANAINIESEWLHPQRKSNFTQMLGESDKRRSQHTSFLFKITDAMLMADTPQQVSAAQTLSFALRPFLGCVRIPRKQKTVVIKQLLKVLSQKKCVNAIEKLNIQATVKKLKDENEHFADLERESTKQKAPEVQTDVHRADTDSLYKEITDIVNAHLVLAPNENLRKFANNIKKLIRNTRKYYNMRCAGNVKRKKNRIMTDKIKDLGQSKLNNAEHVAFHTDCKAYLKDCNPARVSCNELEPLYTAAINAEQSMLNRQQASTITPALEESDAKREKLHSYLWASVKNAKNSPVEADVEAYNALIVVMKPFSEVASSPNKQESVEIDEMIKVLSEDENMPHITALRLNAVLASLDAENKNYMNLERQRTSDTPNKAETERLRTTTDSIYTQITDRANATVILASNAEAELFVKNINKLIDKTNTYNAQRSKNEEEQE